ncbi:MAG TPA: DUF2059 domain-containing protein [Terriglobia bacterium]|nr:DUF2059 domain-containing protein [Terriglobia bacterium]
MKAKLFRIGFLVVLSSPMVFAGQKPQITPPQEAEIRELLRVTGMTETVGRQMNQMADQLKPLLENSLPPGQRRHEIVETFTKKFLARANSEALLQQIIPIYAKYMSEEDVKAVIRFYKSPAGQRLLKVMPEMMQESSEVGKQWGENLAREVMDEMAQEYPEMRQNP